MGYTTDFEGELEFTPTLSAKQTDYILRFNETRRMGRDPQKLMEAKKGKNGLPFIFNPTNKLGEDMKDLEDEFGLDVGEKGAKRNPEEIYGKYGEFYVGEDDTGIIDYNIPPGHLPFSAGSFEANLLNVEKYKLQPGLWCNWTTHNGSALSWDGGEKFYNYIEWLKYMIDNFFIPWGIKLNGKIEWTGEAKDDLGLITVVDNKVTTKTGEIVYK